MLATPTCVWIKPDMSIQAVCNLNGQYLHEPVNTTASVLGPCKVMAPLQHMRTPCRDELLEVAVELEHVATSDEYFVKRGLYPNVDFYSGIVLRAMGIPVSM